MQCSLRLLPLRRTPFILRPEHAPFSRQASLTSAISRGIRRTQGGIDSLERRTSARPSGETGEDFRRQSTWRTRDDDREGAGQPKRSFTPRVRDTENSYTPRGRDTASNFTSRSRDTENSFKPRGRDTGSSFTPRGRDTGSTFTPKSRDTGSSFPPRGRDSQSSFTSRSRDAESSDDRHGHSQGPSKWQPNSDNLRRNDREQGSSFRDRRPGRDESESRQITRSSPFDRDTFNSTGKAGSRSAERSQANDGPNRKERRLAKFGTKTWPDSSQGGRRGIQAEDNIRPRSSRTAREPFEAEDIEEDVRGRGSLQTVPDYFGPDRYRKEFRPKPSSWSGEGHENPRDYGDSKRRRIGKDDYREDGKSIVRKGTVQPYTKVPLSIPYTTAGSEFLYGTHVVKAALQSGRRKLYKLYIYQGVNSEGDEVQQDNAIYKLALAASVPVSKVRGEWEKLLNKMSDQRPHNGYVLEASPVPKLPVTALEKVESPLETFAVQLGHQSEEELAINSTFDIHGSLATLPAIGGTQRYPFVVMLDRIRDPGNLGSIIRSAHFLGAEALVLIEHGTAPIGPVALKSSASAAEYLPLLKVKNEHTFMRTSQENGWKVFAATSPDSTSAGANGLKLLPCGMITALQKGPCVLLLGSEGEGIRPQLQRIVNGVVGVDSGRGSVQGLDSLNVGVAGALLMQEFLHGSKRAASESEGASDERLLQEDPEKVF